MSNLDWYMALLLAPCLLFRRTRTLAIVLLLIFPTYALTKEFVSTGMLRYIMFGTQDAISSIIFIYLAAKKNNNTQEYFLAALSASAVITHAFGWSLHTLNASNTIYVNACILILSMQIMTLYIRILLHGRCVNSGFRILVFRVINGSYCYNGKQLIKDAQNKKG